MQPAVARIIVRISALLLKRRETRKRGQHESPLLREREGVRAGVSKALLLIFKKNVKMRAE
jgi:hypothetical protein